MSHVGGLDYSLDVGKLADVLEYGTTPEIQKRLDDLERNGGALRPMGGSNTTANTEDRVGARKGQKAMYVRNMRRLYEEEERQSRQLRQQLKAANARLTSEHDQAIELSARLKDIRLRESAANDARRHAQSEAMRAEAEARALKLHLEVANIENSKAQLAVNRLSEERAEAERSASRARDTARKLQEQLIRERALQEGRHEGLSEGIRVGYDEGLGDGWIEGHDDGFDEMRNRAIGVWEAALKSGAINPNAEFDLDKAIRMEAAKSRAAITSVTRGPRGPSRRASVRESLSRYAAPNGHSRNKSVPSTANHERFQSVDTMFSPKRVPVPPLPADLAPLISEVTPGAAPPDIKFTVTSPPDTRSARSPSPSMFPNHPHVDPLYDGVIPMADADGRIRLPAPHDINPSPSAINVPLPSTKAGSTRSRAHSVISQAAPSVDIRTPRQRRPSLSASAAGGESDAEPFSHREGAKLQAQLQAEEEASRLREQTALLAEELEKQKALNAADMAAREEAERARERTREAERLAEEAERELEHARLRQASAEVQRWQEEAAREKEEREREREAAAQKEADNLAAEVVREAEREREKRATEAEREAERIEAEAQRIRLEIERARLENERQADAARAEAERANQAKLDAERAQQARIDQARLEQERANTERAEEELRAFQEKQVAALIAERDLPPPPPELSVRNGGQTSTDEEDEDDSEEPDAPGPYNRLGSKRRTKRGSQHSGHSTAWSKFTVLESDETKRAGEKKRQEHRDATLERVNNPSRQHQTRSQRERSETAGFRTPYTNGLPAIRESNSISSFGVVGGANGSGIFPSPMPPPPTVPANLVNGGGGGYQQQPQVRTPHPSLPALPITLEKQYPPPVGIPPQQQQPILAPVGRGPTARNRKQDWTSEDEEDPDYEYEMRNPIVPNVGYRGPVPVPAPESGPRYVPPPNRGPYAARSPYSRNPIEELRSPSPTPSSSRRVGKPVSPIPTIFVERPSNEGLRQASSIGGKPTTPTTNGFAATGGVQSSAYRKTGGHKSILKQSTKRDTNVYNDASTSSPSLSHSRPAPATGHPTNAWGPNVPASAVPKSPWNNRTVNNVLDSPQSSVKDPVTADMIPNDEPAARMQRPSGYRVPAQSTDIDLFGEPGRAPGIGIGHGGFNPAAAESFSRGGSMGRSATGNGMASHHPSPRVDPVAQMPTFGGPSTFGAAGQTPFRAPLSRPIGTPAATYESQVLPPKTPKTPAGGFGQPRLQRPLGAPGPDPAEIPVPVTPGPQTFSAVATPRSRLQRPIGAAPVNDWDDINDNDEGMMPAMMAPTIVPQVMQRPGMQQWDAMPRQDMSHSTVRANHFSTPGPAHRALVGQPMGRPQGSGVAAPTMGFGFGGANNAAVPPWMTGPSQSKVLPFATPARGNSKLPGSNGNDPVIPNFSDFGAIPAFGAAPKPPAGVDPYHFNVGRGSTNGGSPVVPSGVPTFAFTGPSPSPSPAPPDVFIGAYAGKSRSSVRSSGGGSPAFIPANIPPSPRRSVIPPSPARTNRSVKMEEVTDAEAGPPRVSTFQPSPWGGAGMDLWSEED